MCFFNKETREILKFKRNVDNEAKKKRQEKKIEKYYQKGKKYQSPKKELEALQFNLNGFLFHFSEQDHKTLQEKSKFIQIDQSE